MRLGVAIAIRPRLGRINFKKVLIMDKSEILWAIVCLAVFAYIGVLLAWRG
jgi:hypothetical protein